MKNAMVNPRKRIVGVLALFLLTVAAPLIVRVARADDAPQLPAYFTGTSADPAKPTWPDPTGAASGVWATPAGDGKGDVPERAVDRRRLRPHRPQPLLDQLRVGAGHRLPGHVHAGRLHVRRDRAVPREERRAHLGDELHDLSARLPRRSGSTASRSAGATGGTARCRRAGIRRSGPGSSVLNSGIGLGAAVDAAGNATGAFTYGLIGHEGLLPRQRRRRRRRDGAVLLHDGVHGHHGDDPDRRDGRALGVEELLPLRPLGRAARTASTPTGSGAAAGSRRAASTGASATARSTSPAPASCTRWAASSRSPARSSSARASASTSNGKPQAMPGHNVPMVVLGTFILAFGWFGFNPGSTLVRHRPAHQLRRRQHDARQHHRRARRDARRCRSKGLKPDPTMLCNGMLAGLVAITAPCAFVDPWAAAVIGAIAGVLVVVSVFFFESARHRRSRRRDLGPRRERPLGRALGRHLRHRRSTAPAGTASCATRSCKAYGSDGVRGLLYGDSSQFIMQVDRLRRAWRSSASSWPTSGSRSAT